MVEEVRCVALVREEPKEIRFKKWTKARYLMPLCIKAYVNGKPVNRVLIDGEAMLNVMPYSTDKRLGRSCKDLRETNMTMSNFTKGNILALGFLIAELIVRSRTTNTVFCKVDVKPSYVVLLGREWIYAN